MKKQEQGQILPLGLVVIVACMVGALVLFNTSKAATDKMRLANSADAAAYSGALWQARAMNYQAYANRAMVANQVSIAQAVSLSSWMNYASFVSSNVATLLSGVPVVNFVTTGVDSAVAGAEQAVYVGATAAVTASNAMNAALSISQDVMLAATIASSKEVIDAVTKETDPRFTTYSYYGIGLAGLNATDWVSFNQRYGKFDTSAMQERAGIISDSRDGFTQSRNWTFLNNNWIPTGFNQEVKLRRQGATQLFSVDTPQGQEWEWVAKDTMSLHTRSWGGWFGSDEHEAPLAWASSFANSRNRSRYLSAQCGSITTYTPGVRRCLRMTRNNHNAEKYAAYGIRSLRGRSPLDSIRGYGGIRSYWGLSEDIREQDDARMKVMVEVTLPLEGVVESDTVLPSSKLSTPVAVAGGVSSSLSSADVFYRRPDHHSTSVADREKANEYNPYWQAQLSPVTEVERYAATLVRPDLAKSMTRDGEFLHRSIPTPLDHIGSHGNIQNSSSGALSIYVD